MSVDLLLALTLLGIGVEHFTPLPNWVVGILAIVTGVWMLIGG